MTEKNNVPKKCFLGTRKELHHDIYVITLIFFRKIYCKITDNIRDTSAERTKI